MDVTRQQLATALESFVLQARPLTVTGAGDPVTVQVDGADDFARALYATLSRMAALREDGGADPELAAMARIHAELDGLDLMARSRILAYEADRLGVDL